MGHQDAVKLLWLRHLRPRVTLIFSRLKAQRYCYLTYTLTKNDNNVYFFESSYSANGSARAKKLLEKYLEGPDPSRLR